MTSESVGPTGGRWLSVWRWSRRTLAVAACLLIGSAAGAQQPSTAVAPNARSKASQAIEIRGQVPTPQVVTVRPRQIPMFSRAILTPAFFDRHFADALIAPYEIMPNLSTVAGAVPVSVTLPGLPADGAHRLPPADSSGHAGGSSGALAPNPVPTTRSSPSGAARGSTSNVPREK